MVFIEHFLPNCHIWFASRDDRMDYQVSLYDCNTDLNRQKSTARNGLGLTGSFVQMQLFAELSTVVGCMHARAHPTNLSRCREQH